MTMEQLASAFMVLIAATVSGCVLMIVFIGLTAVAEMFPDFLQSIKRCQKAWREFMEDQK